MVRGVIPTSGRGTGGMTGRATPPPRRELVTLLAYLDTGSHKAAAYRLGISESTSRQRVSQLMRRVGATNAAQAVRRLRQHLQAESRASW